MNITTLTIPVTTEREKPVFFMDEKAHQLSARLKEAMENHKIYRDPTMTLVKLAAKMGVTRHELSRHVNCVYRLGFNEYLNTYRLNETAQRLLECKTPVLQLAFESGFNSKATFNRIFKTRMGITPTEYRRFRGLPAEAVTTAMLTEATLTEARVSEAASAGESFEKVHLAV